MLRGMYSAMVSRVSDKDWTSSENGGRCLGLSSQHCNIKEYLDIKIEGYMFDYNIMQDSYEFNSELLHVIAASRIFRLVQTLAIF